jgi:hypothetical protein
VLEAIPLAVAISVAVASWNLRFDGILELASSLTACTLAFELTAAALSPLCADPAVPAAVAVAATTTPWFLLDSFVRSVCAHALHCLSTSNSAGLKP